MMIAGRGYALGAITHYIVRCLRLFIRYDVNYDTFYPLQAVNKIMSAAIYPIDNWLVDKIFNWNSRPVLAVDRV